MHVGGQRQAPGERTKATTCTMAAWQEAGHGAVRGRPARKLLTNLPSRCVRAAHELLLARCCLRAAALSPRSTTWTVPQVRPARSSALRTACTRLSSSSPNALSCGEHSRRDAATCAHACQTAGRWHASCQLTNTSQPYHSNSSNRHQRICRGLQPPSRWRLIRAAGQHCPLLLQRRRTQLAGVGHFWAVWREHAGQQRVVQQAAAPAWQRGGQGWTQGSLNRCTCVWVLCAAQLQVRCTHLVASNTRGSAYARLCWQCGSAVRAMYGEEQATRRAPGGRALWRPAWEGHAGEAGQCRLA